ncbi:HGxxPAAW family protein [Streptomyces sp. NPDC006798]|uniref:HGxxPAAW family protein n=1 Tax=Streptomyces sp. NPDC006798 TaxID=3155462 RepID=UPI0033C005D8
MSAHDHGHTPAAWTGSTISFIGFCVAGVFMVGASPAGFWLGMVIVVLGGVVGMGMRAAGLGARGESADRKNAREQAGRIVAERVAARGGA